MPLTRGGDVNWMRWQPEYTKVLGATKWMTGMTMERRENAKKFVSPQHSSLSVSKWAVRLVLLPCKCARFGHASGLEAFRVPSAFLPSQSQPFKLINHCSIGENEESWAG